MKTRYTVALSMLAGIAIGAVAIQGLHAQAKPKAYVISETEVLDAAALAAYSPLIRAATDAAGGRRLSPPGGTIVAFAGEPPKRVGSRSGTAWRKRRPSATRQPTRTWLRSVTRRSRQYGHMPSRCVRRLPRPPQLAASSLISR
jgi:hypothetical protein